MLPELWVGEMGHRMGHQAATPGNVGFTLQGLLCEQDLCMQGGGTPRDLLHQLATLASIRHPCGDRPVLQARRETARWSTCGQDMAGVPPVARGPRAFQVLAGLGAHSG